MNISEEVSKSDEQVRIDCNFHGSMPAAQFICDNELLKKVCFKCWMQHTTQGLIDYAHPRIDPK